MHDDTPETAARLDSIERRLARLEETLLGSPARRETPTPAPAPNPTPVATTPAPAPPPARVASIPPRTAPIARPAPAMTPPAPPAQMPRPAPGPSPDPKSLERLIGGRWFAAIGAVAIVIGLALSLRLAWNAGYLRLPPVGQVLAVAGFGAVLIAAGEVVLRRFGRAASVGLFGAGVGALFVAAYGAHAYHTLIDATGAFVMMACASAVGILISVRANLVSIGILALVGAYLTPILAPSPDASVYALPIYLLGLTAVGVGLAWWRERYGAARAFAWTATTVVGTLWVTRVANADPWVALAFVGAVWGGFHFERVCILRPRGTEPEPEWDHDTAPFVAVTPGESVGLLGGVILSAWGAIVGWAILEETGAAPTWVIPAGMAVMSFMGAIVMVGLMSPLRERPRTPAERLGTTLMAQGGAMLFAAIALALSGWVETLTWTVMGVAAIAAGRMARARALDIFGVVVLAFGTVRALMFEPLVNNMHGTGLETLGLVITPWTGLLVANALALVVAARLMAWGHQAWREGARALGVVAFAMVLLGFFHKDADPRSIIFAMLGVSLAVSVFGNLERTLGLHRVAPAGVLAALIAWSFAELTPGWSTLQAAPGLHPGVWEALAIGAGAVVLGTLARWPRTDRWAGVHAAPWALAALLFFAASSLEVARSAEILLTDETVRSGAISIWWGMFAVGLVVVGVVRRVPPVRWAGLGLMLCAVGKVLIVDLQGTSQGVRVASFLGLGVLMVAVAAGYLRVSKAARERGASAPQTDESAGGVADDRGGEPAVDPDAPGGVPGRA